LITVSYSPCCLVAVQCLESCFELNQDEDAASPLNNVDLFDLFINSYVNVNPERKSEAENLKNDGNRLMKEEKYNEALVAYGRAIALDASNPIYYCNRAAAFSRIGDFQKAVDDCNQAIRYDPNYGKGEK
jgi:small glutamine-rich tetratricopeptide repeat-containing protein alpha